MMMMTMVAVLVSMTNVATFFVSFREPQVAHRPGSPRAGGRNTKRPEPSASSWASSCFVGCPFFCGKFVGCLFVCLFACFPAKLFSAVFQVCMHCVVNKGAG